MSKIVTCVMCGAPVDDADTVHMPNGQMCVDPCYVWLEKMIEEADADPDEDEDNLFWDDDEDNEEDTYETDTDSRSTATDTDRLWPIGRTGSM